MFNFGGGLVKYLVIGIVAAILPSILTKYIPGMSGLTGATLSIALIVAGVLIMKYLKVPYLGQGLIIGGAISLANQYIVPLLGGVT